MLTVKAWKQRTPTQKCGKSVKWLQYQPAGFRVPDVPDSELGRPKFNVTKLMNPSQSQNLKIEPNNPCFDPTGFQRSCCCQIPHPALLGVIKPNTCSLKRCPTRALKLAPQNVDFCSSFSFFPNHMKSLDAFTLRTSHGLLDLSGRAVSY